VLDTQNGTGNGYELIETIHDMFLNYPDIETQIIAASVRNPIHVTDCALAKEGNFAAPGTPGVLSALGYRPGDFADGPVMYVAAAEGDGDMINGRGDAYCGMLNCSYNLGMRH
ncbi:hypothetical protein H6B10_15875, partial [Gemmiger formicilis]|nr:hypothetical protein [Gemmiger formicilis]